ncbi:hypothetical protein [Kineococcus glutinatus]|uniref:DUF4352 domain-containing protein n=1 Tax=Kineococcus glutinatus TaxID=1070872 RepID=A0ABP9H6G1_9ACTN
MSGGSPRNRCARHRERHRNPLVRAAGPGAALTALVLVAACSPGDSVATVAAPAPTAVPSTATPSAAPVVPGADPLAAAAPRGKPSPPRYAVPGAGSRRRAAVPPGREAVTAEGFAARVTSTEEVQLTALNPGEVAGPGVAVHIDFRNGSTSPVDLDGVTVTASTRNGTPAPGSDVPPQSLPTGLLQPGGTATGTYVFQLARGNARTMIVEITTISSPDVLVVRG